MSAAKRVDAATSCERCWREPCSPRPSSLLLRSCGAAMTFDALDLSIALMAGGAAGVMNAIVGAGTLATFPVLLALGLPPVTANVTSAVGVFPGSLAAAWAYRGRLGEQRLFAAGATVAMCLGVFAGAGLLLVLDPSVFEFAVPWLILGAGGLLAVQPQISRRWYRAANLPPQPQVAGIGMALAGVYLGYFGAATGVLTLAALLVAGMRDLQQANALKNLSTGVANGFAALTFLVLGVAVIPFAAAIAVGAVAGGLLGGALAQKLSNRSLRSVAIGIAVTAAAYAAWGT
jgi:uncharacterized protein